MFNINRLIAFGPQIFWDLLGLVYMKVNLVGEAIKTVFKMAIGILLICIELLMESFYPLMITTITTSAVLNVIGKLMTRILFPLLVCILTFVIDESYVTGTVKEFSNSGIVLGFAEHGHRFLVLSIVAVLMTTLHTGVEVSPLWENLVQWAQSPSIVEITVNWVSIFMIASASKITVRGVVVWYSMHALCIIYRTFQTLWDNEEDEDFDESEYEGTDYDSDYIYDENEESDCYYYLEENVQDIEETEEKEKEKSESESEGEFEYDAEYIGDDDDEEIIIGFLDQNNNNAPPPTQATLYW